MISSRYATQYLLSLSSSIEQFSQLHSTNLSYLHYYTYTPCHFQPAFRTSITSVTYCNYFLTSHFSQSHQCSKAASNHSIPYHTYIRAYILQYYITYTYPTYIPQTFHYIIRRLHCSTISPEFFALSSIHIAYKHCVRVLIVVRIRFSAFPLHSTRLLSLPSDIDRTLDPADVNIIASMRAQQQQRRVK